MHPHTLRYTFATRLFEAGMDIKTVQHLMGHAKPEETLAIYVKYCEDSRAAETAERLRAADKINVALDDLGSGATFYYTTNASNIPDETYFYTRMQFDIAGNMLSAFNSLMREDENGSRVIWNTPYSQYVRGEMTL